MLCLLHYSVYQCCCVLCSLDETDEAEREEVSICYNFSAQDIVNSTCLIIDSQKVLLLASQQWLASILLLIDRLKKIKSYSF